MRRKALAIALGLTMLLTLGSASGATAGLPAGLRIPSEYPPSYVPWALDVRKRVMRTLAARRPDRTMRVVVTFKVHRDGRITDVNVTGDPGAVAFVSAGMRRIARVPPYPSGVRHEVVPLQVTVSYVDRLSRRRR